MNDTLLQAIPYSIRQSIWHSILNTVCGRDELTGNRPCDFFDTACNRCSEAHLIKRYHGKLMDWLKINKPELVNE